VEISSIEAKADYWIAGPLAMVYDISPEVCFRCSNSTYFFVGMHLYTRTHFNLRLVLPTYDLFAFLT
jgi:hypothetical protein